MIGIAQLSKEGKPVPLVEVSETSGISRRYLELLTVSLRNSGLVKGYPGRDGGFILGRKASEIRVGEIVEAAIGRVSISDCIDCPESCERSESCLSRPLWSLVNRRIAQTLYEFSLADVLHEDWPDHLVGDPEPSG